ncbi:hypothetical protein lbkm_0712 [Lachnospiraceae bacterium KM106-2]|nr:hypothetical protein lbkm_0712 [Lachnospiraceae bacterium KM106-2]
MKKKLIAAFGISAMVLTGCGNGVISLESNEQAIISNYMADILLKYDTKTTHKLLAYDQVSKDGNEEGVTPSPEVSADVTSTTSPATTAQPDATTSNSADSKVEAEEKTTEFNGDYGKGIKVSYGSYSLEKSYHNKKTSDYFNLEAEKGFKFLVVNFKVENTANEKTACNLLKKAEYVLQSDGKVVSSSLVTMLPNDLSALNTTLNANESLDTVLLFRVPDDMKLESAKIIVTKDKTSSEILIK